MPCWWSKRINRLNVLKQIRSPYDLCLFSAMFAFAAVTPLLMRLRLARLETLLTWLCSSPPPEDRSSLSPEAVQQIAAYMDGVIQLGRPLIRPGCLTRGLTQYYFLRRRGLHVDLYFGTGQVDNAFAAHCWLVKNNEPFLEKTDPRLHFNPIHAIPTEALTA